MAAGLSRCDVDCVVVGAGPSGLAVSLALTERNVEHLVLERGQVAETWRTQRWDSFRLNTAGWANRMLGEQTRDAYLTGYEVVSRLEKLAVDCPVLEGVRVEELTWAGDGYLLRTGGGEVRSRAVVVATGDENAPKLPRLSKAFPDRIAQYHAADYRKPAQLPDGAVLVVGSAQSGCQITEELLAAGRRVILATSPVGRAPTPYRGRDTAEWLLDFGFFDQRPQDLPDPSMMRAHVPILGPGGHGLSLQMLARAGATLVGRLIDVDTEQVRFDGSAAANVAAGDAFAERARAMIDSFIAQTGAHAPPAEPDQAGGPIDLESPTRLDLRDAGLGSVVWCTGFGSDFSWLDPSLLDDHGRPRHQNVASDLPGLYYVGLRWLTHRSSAQLPGIPKDAVLVADAIAAHVAVS